MSWKQNLKDEVKSICITTLYFACCFFLMIFIKMLLLKEYHIEFYGFSKVLVGALIAAKVVLIMDKIHLGLWLQKKPAIVDLVFRTILYSVGIIIVIVLEKGFEGRHEFGGFFNSIIQGFDHADAIHIYVNSIVTICALLGFNFFSLVEKHHLDKGGLQWVLFSPPPIKKAKKHIKI